MDRRDSLAALDRVNEAEGRLQGPRVIELTAAGQTRPTDLHSSVELRKDELGALDRALAVRIVPDLAEEDTQDPGNEWQSTIGAYRNAYLDREL